MEAIYRLPFCRKVFSLTGKRLIFRLPDYTLPLSPVYACIPRIYSIFCCLEKYMYILADATMHTKSGICAIIRIWNS